MSKLNKQEIQDKMKGLDVHWVLKGKFIHREFNFKDFIQAFSFITSIALIAEKSGHHPNWKNVYSKVTIALNTHDEDGLTDKDFLLAKKIDEVVKNFAQ